jgi:hypothetical protein
MRLETISLKVPFFTGSNQMAWTDISLGAYAKTLRNSSQREAFMNNTTVSIVRCQNVSLTYAIYYLAAGEIVDVVAILNCRRDPATIVSRLGRTKR